jgi:hypothetical protein
MHVYIDDSGDGGFKLEGGSSSHLVMAAVVFRDPREIERLAHQLEGVRQRFGTTREFKYHSTSKKIKDAYFTAIAPVGFHIRAICIDKRLIFSEVLRGDPSLFKSWAIRMLLTKNYGQITDAKVFIDGQDTKGFGVSDDQYLIRMVNKEAPGTIGAVRFIDSKQSAPIQLADMVAGAIRCGSLRGDECKPKHLRMIRPRTWQPEGSLWHFK